MHKRNRFSHTLEEKIKILQQISSGLSNAEVCRKNNLSSSTVSTIWKNRDKIRGTVHNTKLRRIRRPANNELDRALLEWVEQKRAQNVAVSGPKLQEKAEELSRLLSPNNETHVCSRSWIDRFKKRYHISSARIQEEAASVSLQTTRDWFDNIWLQIRSGYSDNDIFSGVETGLFYKLTPNQSPKFQEEQCARGRNCKERITIFLCANMTGSEKRKLLVVGKSKKPKCFKTCQVLPVNYIANKKAWVTPEIFEKEIRSWDSDLQKQRRKIILLVYDCPAHPKIENLRSIDLVFLPQNTASVLQPMDQGIVASLKQHYKKILLRKMIPYLSNGEEFKFSLLDCALALNTAWKGISQNTIVNSYRQAGFYPKLEFVEDPLAQGTLQNNDLESAGDEEYSSLHDWAIKNNFLNEYFDSDALNSFQDVDNCLVTCEYPQETEIPADTSCETENNAELETSEEEEEKEEEQDIFEPPTPQEVLSAMKTVSVYLEFNEFDRHIKDKFDFIQKRVENSIQNKTQKKITDYFK